MCLQRQAVINSQKANVQAYAAHAKMKQEECVTRQDEVILKIGMSDMQSKYYAALLQKDIGESGGR